MPGTFSGKVTPIKVKIGLRPNGHADHPDWKKLPLMIAGGKETDHMAGGWIYDKCGHQESDPESPLGMQWGVLMVSEQFANEAVAIFPATIRKITSEAELQTFIEERCTAHLPEFRLDVLELQALKAELDLAKDLKLPTGDLNEIEDRCRKALDPDDKLPGKKKQKGKKWSDIKSDQGIDLSDEVGQ